MSLNLEQYVSEFSAQNITGEQLLQLDGNKLKVKNSVSVWGYQVSVVSLMVPEVFPWDKSVLPVWEGILINGRQKGHCIVSEQ